MNSIEFDFIDDVNTKKHKNIGKITVYPFNFHLELYTDSVVEVDLIEGDNGSGKTKKNNKNFCDSKLKRDSIIDCAVFWNLEKENIYILRFYTGNDDPYEILFDKVEKAKQVRDFVAKFIYGKDKTTELIERMDKVLKL